MSPPGRPTLASSVKARRRHCGPHHWPTRPSSACRGSDSDTRRRAHRVAPFVMAERRRSRPPPDSSAPKVRRPIATPCGIASTPLAAPVRRWPQAPTSCRHRRTRRRDGPGPRQTTRCRKSDTTLGPCIFSPPDGEVITDFTPIGNVNCSARPSGQRVGVLRRLVLRHHGRVRHLDAPQPLDARVAFPTRQQEAHRVPVLRTQTLAVLVDRNQRVVERLVDRHAAAHRRGVRALGEQPAAGRTHARLLKKGAERHARPFAARQEAMQRTCRRLAPAARAYSPVLLPEHSMK